MVATQRDDESKTREATNEGQISSWRCMVLAISFDVLGLWLFDLGTAHDEMKWFKSRVSN